MVDRMSRRRFIGISAALAGLSLLPPRAVRAEDGAQVWHGFALGAPAMIVLNHPDKAEARRLFGRIEAETERLKAIFSLFRSDSELALLNRTGALAAPSAEMVDLLARCRDIHRESGGLFDPTVQPLWTCLFRHFSASDPDPAGPAAEEMRQALDLVGFDALRANADRIAFSRRGMALTLNGVAQGYITDRITALLAENGLTQSLVDMGEYRALGTRPDGTPWRVGLSTLESDATPDRFVDLAGKALATSSAEGFSFDASGRFNHLLDPRTGLSASLYAYLTVVAPDAAGADAWATAFSLMSPEEIARVVKAQGNITVYLRQRDGKRLVLSA
ncbi:MAG: thiamine biosynthesis protein ApbE [Rhizobiales bacterium 63-7]|nr:MAG: thiamine biosynthesis protein ApbE [Rhizobiales bacterium 63-7]